MKVKKCYLYTRVSTSMQVDGFSLDAQKERLRKYAEFQEMIVAGEYSDEGKSGKNIEGRPQFQQMLNDIETGKDNIDFVLVFKLSRFGRNAADVLGSLQRMQDFGVNLICVEDGIDSSKDSGKLMISVLSAVAEIERENILVQTMEGRRQKAREGKWNGGFAPYGYKLVDGYLQIAEDEIEVIQIIFDKYVNTNMGAPGIASYLNEQGYVKKKRQNNTLDVFSTSFVRGVLENPIYAGKLAYGRRKTEKIPGTRNQFHIVEQKEFPVYDGAHEGIISEEVWQQAQKKRQESSCTWEKVHHPERENLLSGLLRCPVCGAGMYGNVNRKRKKDGGFYKEYYYYACKHRLEVDGHRCDYNRQWKQERVDDAVTEVIKKLVRNPKFEAAIREKIGSRIDTEELENELEGLRKRQRQLIGAKKKLGQQIDKLDITDPFYDQKYQDMDERLCKLYEDIDVVERNMEEIQTRLDNIRQQKISSDNIYQFLLYFDLLYDKFTDSEKKEFLQSFVERVEVFPEEQPGGRFLKRIKFRFPVYFDGAEVENMRWDNETTVESVVCLTRKQVDDKKQAFFNNAKLLADTLGITPLMYGSLGLEYLTGKNLNADDIDILIPRTFLADRWRDFQAVLEKNGYTLIDEHEHTFEKEGIHYSYAQVEELESFAGIPVSEIQTLKNGNVHFKLLSLQQYLKVYTASAKDGYRIYTKNKKDSEKIAVIQNQLSFQLKESKDESVVTIARP